MDPDQNRSQQQPSSSKSTGPGQTADASRQPADRRPQHSDGFTMFPPNVSRLSQMKMMAQKEEEEFQQWKEMRRVPSVHVDPERLGGDGTLAEARDKQLANLRCSKLQKKLQRQEQEKRKKQEEEDEQQRMKAEQRQKAERLEGRRHEEEQRRREQLDPDRLRKTESFLQDLERRAPGAPASCRQEAVESRGGDVELEHKRVNAAFLDRLEARGRESSVQEAERPSPEQRVLPEPGRGGSWTQAADPEPDFDWALMKLVNSFPDCARVFLEDILSQCGGDYQEAHTLLLGALS